MDWILLLFALIQQTAHAFIGAKWLSRGTNKKEFFWCFAAVFQLELSFLVCCLSTVEKLNSVGIISALGLISIAVVVWQKKRNWVDVPRVPRLPGILKPDNLLYAIPAIIIVVLIILKTGLPVHRFDDLSYHGARTLYWIQNQSAEHFETNNERNNVLTFGSEIWFFEGLSFTGKEAAGQALHSIWIILSALGFILLSRSLGATKGASVMALSVLLLLPTVQFNFTAIKPEAISILSFLGIIWYTRILLISPDSWNRAMIGTILWMCIGTSCRVYFVLLGLPLVVVWVWQFLRHRLPMRAFVVRWCFVTLLGLLTSSVAYTCLQNYQMYGNIFGPDVMRYMHKANISGEQLAVHAARTPFILMQGVHLPASWNEKLKPKIEQLAGVTGADTELLWEHKLPWWPGYFNPWPDNALRHSYLGIPLIAVFAGLLFYLGSLIKRSDRKTPWGPWIFTALLSLYYAASIVAVFRWQTMAGLPERFLIPPAAGIIILAAVLASRLPKSLTINAAIVICTGWLVWPGLDFVRSSFQNFSKETASYYHHPASLEVDAALPAQARVLVFGSDCDYALFSPRNGFTRTVIPWGKGEIKKSSLENVLEVTRPDFIIFPQTRWVTTMFTPPLDMRVLYGLIEDLPRAKEMAPIAHYRVYEITWQSRRSMEDFLPPSPKSTYLTSYIDHPVFGETLQFENGWVYNKWVRFADFSHYPEIVFPNSLDRQTYDKTDNNNSLWFNGSNIGPIAINPKKFPVGYSARQNSWFIPLYDRIDASGFLNLQTGKPFVPDAAAETAPR